MTEYQRYTARDRKMMLEGLANSAGFQILCERWHDKVARDLDAKIFDVKTSDTEARILRETRARLMDAYQPKKLIESLIAQAKTEAAREET